MSKSPVPAKKREAVVFGPALAAARKAKKVNQATLARRSGVAEGTIATLETGRRQPSRETLEALAGELGVPVESIGLFCTPEQADLLAELLPDLVQFTRDEVVARVVARAEPAA